MHSVEIDGEVYWDGGFAGSPVIFPLVYECETRDIVLVHLTPAERPEIPTASHAIMNCMQEIGFNSALIREMRAVAFVTKLIDEGRLADSKRMLIHVIEAEDVIRELPGSSRLNNSWDFFAIFTRSAEQEPGKWLADNFEHLGKELTVDLEEKYF